MEEKYIMRNSICQLQDMHVKLQRRTDFEIEYCEEIGKDPTLATVELRHEMRLLKIRINFLRAQQAECFSPPEDFHSRRAVCGGFSAWGY